MKQEDKQLLLKDLCARLPYGVIVDYAYNTFKNGLKESKLTILTCNILSTFISPRMNETNEYIKPYLRPMSSMTEKEKGEYTEFIFDYEYDDYWHPGKYTDAVYVDVMSELIDWLNAHYFDYRNLIERGLVLPAPEGMYNV